MFPIFSFHRFAPSETRVSLGFPVLDSKRVFIIQPQSESSSVPRSGEMVRTPTHSAVAPHHRCRPWHRASSSELRIIVHRDEAQAAKANRQAAALRSTKCSQEMVATSNGKWVALLDELLGAGACILSIAVPDSNGRKRIRGLRALRTYCLLFVSL
jgi:hypothetical protein